MPIEKLLALVSFAFVTTFTPGPNHIMLTASGANFGFVRSLPHMLGVWFGFFILLAAAGAGLGVLMAKFPEAETILKVVGSAYMLWLAWKFAHAGQGKDRDDDKGRPLTFLQAAGFQWVNPKGFVVALDAVALYVRPGHAVVDLAVLLAAFGLITLLSTVVWLSFGTALSRVLRDHRKAQIFNVSMALLLVASIIPMVL